MKKEKQFDGRLIAPVISALLTKKKRKQMELSDFMGLTSPGLRYKLNDGYFSKEEIDKLAVFFGVKHTEILGETVENHPNGGQYLQDYLDRLEQRFTKALEQRDQAIEQRDKVIDDLRYVIENMKSQGLGKEWHSEEELPVRHLDSLKLKPLVPVVIGQAV